MERKDCTKDQIASEGGNDLAAELKSKHKRTQKQAQAYIGEYVFCNVRRTIPQNGLVPQSGNDIYRGRGSSDSGSPKSKANEQVPDSMSQGRQYHASNQRSTETGTNEAGTKAEPLLWTIWCLKIADSPCGFLSNKAKTPIRRRKQKTQKKKALVNIRRPARCLNPSTVAPEARLPKPGSVLQPAWLMEARPFPTTCWRVTCCSVGNNPGSTVDTYCCWCDRNDLEGIPF